MLAPTIPGTGLRGTREATSLQGYIDGTTPSGIIEGWAVDEQTPWCPLHVKIRCGDRWIACGIAHHYREDVLAARIGTGWCGFRLWSDCAADQIRRSTLYLVEAAGGVIARADRTRLLPEIYRDLKTIADVVAADPTIAQSIEQLRGCDILFARYIHGKGVDAFVRAAYVYVLGRPADETSLEMYGSNLRRGYYKPFELLRILATSKEFSSHRTPLIAPTQSSFPFLLDYN